MHPHVLITGGAGFIGAHVAKALLERGARVRVLDALVPQVHGEAVRPAYLDPEAELVMGDLRDRAAVVAALDGVDAVMHLAASVGVGQSMYQIVDYCEANDVGTAVLLEELAKRPVARLVCASSMSVYGEGLAQRPDGQAVAPPERNVERLRRGDWSLRDDDGVELTPLPTPETKAPQLSSIYALNKFAQERMCLMIGRAYGIPAVALRFFNVYGPHQALSNPYTGVLAIFASRMLNGRPALVYEDGRQMRDFVHVRDVAQACVLALESDAAPGMVFNVGSGESRTVLSIAEGLARVLGKPDLVPHVVGKFRAGDIRHCFADIEVARSVLGYAPSVPFEEGLVELAGWLSEQVARDDFDRASAELERRGLVA